MNRKAYPSDVSDDEWAFVAPYLTLMTEDAPQRTYPLRYDDVTSNQLQAEIASLSKEEHDLYLKLSDAIQRVGAGEDTAYICLPSL
jgi:transposase